MDPALVTALGLGFTLGLRHALDADHLAAVAAMVGGGRRSIAGSSLVGLAWGVGHAASLGAAALLVLLLGVRIPERFALAAESFVGAVLVVLGLRLLRTFRRGAVLHAHPHVHGERAHFHPHVHPPGEAVDPAAHARAHERAGVGDQAPHGAAHAHVETARPAPAGGEPMRSHHGLPAAAERLAAAGARHRGAFLVGLLHGVAGSAALMLLVLATLQDLASRLGFVAIFALGSILGMTAMSALVGLPFALGGAVDGRIHRRLRLAAGGLSVAVGLALIGTVGVAALRA